MPDVGSIDREDLVDKVKTQDAVQHYLMMRSYDEEHKIYAMADLSVGAIYEVTPLAASAMPEDEMISKIETLALTLNRLPEKAIIHWLLVPSLNVDEDLRDYRRVGGSEHPVIAGFEEQVVRHFNGSMTNPLFTIQYGEGAFYTRRFKALLTILVPPTDQVAGAGASIFDFLGSLFNGSSAEEKAKKAKEREVSDELFGLTPAEKRWNGLRSKLTKRMLELKQRIEGTLNQVGLRAKDVPPAELITAYRHLIFPRRSAGRRAEWDPYRMISEQIPLGDIIVEPSSGTVLADGRVNMVVSLSQIPSGSKPGSLTRPHPKFNFHSFLDFLSSGFISVAASAVPLDEMRNFLKERRAGIKGGFAMDSKLEALMGDQNLAEQMLEDGKLTFFWTQVTVVVSGQTERETRDLAQRICDKATDLGLDARVEQHYGPSLYFQSLPGGFAPRIKELRRFMHLPDYAMLDLSPILMQSRGTATPQAMLHNRYGEPIRLHLFDSPGANHAMVVGDSGVGKSVALLYLMMSWLRQTKPKVQIFAFDKGASFAPMTQVLGVKHASYNNVTTESKTTVNPFAGTMASSSTFVSQFLNLLAVQSEKDALESTQRGMIAEAITKSYLAKQDRETWKDIDELRMRYPKGRWIHKARKRLRIKPPEDDVVQTCLSSKAREAGRDLEFEFYLRAVLLKRKIVDPDNPEKLIRVEDCSVYKIVNQETRTWLKEHDFVLEAIPDARAGIDRAVVLFQGRDNAQSLIAAGFEIMVLDKEWILEVGRREDLQAVVMNGVEVIYPDEFLAEVGPAVRAEVERENPGAPQDVLDDMVAQKMEGIQPTDLFDWLEGTVTIQREVFFRDFARELRGYNDERAAALLTRFAPYYGNGPLAEFFDGETKFRLEGKLLTTFEMKELANGGPHLQAAVVGTILQMILLYCQQETFADGGPRGYTKYLVMDEFWEQLANPVVAGLVLNGLKTARKHGLAIVLCTQLVDDFYKTEAGRTVLKSVQHYLMLRQPETTVVKLDEMMQWPPERIALMSTVESAKGLFSEILIHIPNQGITEVARLTLSPWIYWLFTTAPEDVPKRREKVNHYRGQGMSPEDAIAAAVSDLAKLYPNGVSRAKAKGLAA